MTPPGVTEPGMLGRLIRRFLGPETGDRRRWFGSRAERVAARHLRRLGYRILERNVRSRDGELDLVANHGETLVFCEVRSRRTVAGEAPGAGGPGDSIDARKQRQLLRLASGYLQRHPELSGMRCRFDAILVWRTGSEWRVEVVADAFRPGW